MAESNDLRLMTGQPAACPACKATLDRPARSCYVCGLWLRGVNREGPLLPAPASAGPAGPCPHCGYLCPYSSNFCADCGQRLNQDPLDKYEARARVAAAADAQRTPEQRARLVIRSGYSGMAVSIVLFVVIMAAVFGLPGAHAYFLLPIAAALLGSIGVAQRRASRGREQLRRLREAAAKPPLAD